MNGFSSQLRDLVSFILINLTEAALSGRRFVYLQKIHAWIAPIAVGLFIAAAGTC